MLWTMLKDITFRTFQDLEPVGLWLESGVSDSDDEGRDVDIDSEDNSRLSAGDDSRYDMKEI